VNCLQCQAQNPVDAVFCENCGSRLEVACPSCGEANRLGAKFCKKCGHELLEVAPASLVTAGKFASVQTYTPKHLAEKILNSKSSLEGERKQVTVLFADMKGSLELLADRDPEEARKLFDAVIGHMMEAVHRFEGTVNHIMGDGIMALFGAPLAHEDHAVRACYAALNMQESVKRYASEIQRTQGIPIQIRVGLNSGEVVVGTIRNDLHMDYTAIGQTAHLAARMEQMAMPGSILLTPDTLRLAEGYVQVKSLGPVPVKGMSDPVEVFEVTGASAARTRLQAAASRGYTRFVGRDAETEQLRKVLEQARLGHGQVVAVVGEPGVGKSRLFHEFIHSHRTEGWLILESGSVSYGKASPYLPLIELLKAYFKIHDRDNQREIREKVTGKLLTLDESLKPTLPAFLALLDLPIDDPEWQPLDPVQKRQRILDACKRLLFRESQAQPLLLVFEDLHWLDAETQTVLDSMVESLATVRLLLLVNYRPEYQHRWASKTFYTQLRLDPLLPESAEELLQSLLGNDPSLHAVKQLLTGCTEGNPFFLEESVRTLVETKALQGERGAYRLAKPVESIQVPATVQAVLAARIDRLPMEEKRLLQSASVIGEDIPFRILSSVADLSEGELRRGLVHLQAAEFLYEAKLFPDLEYTFKHGLTCQVAYSSLIQDRRRALHSKVSEAIERLYPDRVIEHVERLAHHALRGEVWDKAVIYLRQAGIKAADRSAHSEAITYLEQALEGLKHLPESRQTIEQAIDIRLSMRSSLQPLGEQAKVFDRMREAQELAESLNDQHRLGQVSAYLSGYFTQAGDDPMQAIENGQRALAISAAIGDFSLQVQANHFLGTAYQTAADYDRAFNHFTRNVESLIGDQIYDRFGLAFLPSVGSRYQLVFLLAERGEFTEAAIHGDEAVHIAEVANHPFSLCTAYLGVGHLHLTKGVIDKAIDLLERSLETCRLWHLPQNIPRVAAALGYAYAVAGRLAEAMPLLTLANERARTGNVLRSWTGAQLTLGFLLVGRPQEAALLASRALESSRRHSQRSREALALYLQAEIASAVNPVKFEEAEVSYRAANTIGNELKMRPLLAHCDVALGKLYKRSGELRRAKEHLNDGIAVMRRMGMGLWLDRAKAELKEVG
jgi:class 3 adenylate cyclase/tetratricopeptide (TPR) repeat protein/ribosomal protein L40E